MILYPTELPAPTRNGFNRSQKDNTIRSNMDIGEAKVRRRYTKPIFKEAWTLTLDSFQVPVFETWFNDTLASGVNRFEYEDIISKTTQSYRVEDMPAYTPYGTCGSYVVKFSVERLP